jgi:hypothetical protein
MNHSNKNGELFAESEEGRPLIAHSVQRLKVELIICLDRNEAHTRTLYSFGDCFSVEGIVLVAFDERFHELRRNQTRLMTLRRQTGAQPMRATTGLHTDQAGTQICGEKQQLCSGEALLWLQRCRARRVRPGERCSSRSMPMVRTAMMDILLKPVHGRTAPRVRSQSSGGPIPLVAKPAGATRSGEAGHGVGPCFGNHDL